MRRRTGFMLGATIAVAGSAGAQTSIGPNGIRSGNTVIDASGIHTNGADVTSHGVRTTRGTGTRINANGQHRPVDCRGGELTVNGNSNDLDVHHCSAVVLNGNQNL